MHAKLTTIQIIIFSLNYGSINSIFFYVGYEKALDGVERQTSSTPTAVAPQSESQYRVIPASN